MSGFYHDSSDDLEDLRAEALWERKRHARLMQNPDCRDPDHPGCEHCEERDDDDEVGEVGELEGDDE